jgi:hypothetical protein
MCHFSFAEALRAAAPSLAGRRRGRVRTQRPWPRPPDRKWAAQNERCHWATRRRRWQVASRGACWSDCGGLDGCPAVREPYWRCTPPCLGCRAVSQRIRLWVICATCAGHVNRSSKCPSRGNSGPYGVPVPRCTSEGLGRTAKATCLTTRSPATEVPRLACGGKA